MDKSLKAALIIGGIILAIMIIVPTIIGAVSGWQGYGYGMMGSGMMGNYFGWGWFMPIFMILFWGLVIWGIVALARGTWSGSTDSSNRADSALEILKRRYARGEINKEEYEARKKDLT